MIEFNKHRTGTGVRDLSAAARRGQRYLVRNGVRVQLTTWFVDERFDRGGGRFAKTHYSSGYGLINGRLARPVRPTVRVS